MGQKSCLTGENAQKMVVARKNEAMEVSAVRGYGHGVIAVHA